MARDPDPHLLRKLYNVPPPEPFEAVSAWLTRLGLSQCAPPTRIRHLIGIPNRGDLDRVVRGPLLEELRRVCGLPDTAFGIADRIMTSLCSMSPVGDRYLAVAGSWYSRFRFCPLCLREMPTPHFPVHWRFFAWRWCPKHDCLLEDACPHCGAAIVFPKDFELTFAGRKGYGLLNRCAACANRLDDIEPCLLQLGDRRLVQANEQLKLSNGRALLAALHDGKFSIKGRTRRLPVSWFHVIERHGGLPTRLDWLRPAVIRRRKAELEGL